MGLGLENKSSFTLKKTLTFTLRHVHIPGAVRPTYQAPECTAILKVVPIVAGYYGNSSVWQYCRVDHYSTMARRFGVLASCRPGSCMHVYNQRRTFNLNHKVIYPYISEPSIYLWVYMSVGL